MPLAPFSPRRSTLDKAIIVSVAAMLSMNVLVLAQQLQAAPTVALAQPHLAAQA